MDLSQIHGDYVHLRQIRGSHDVSETVPRLHQHGSGGERLVIREAGHEHVMQSDPDYTRGHAPGHSSEDMGEVIRWGIASTGKISHDFTTAIQMLPAENKVAAVGARSRESAEAFAKQYNIEKAYGSYAELSKDADIDVIYVATINTMHYDVTKMMILAGKNVLCEKPMMMNARQTREILQLAAEKKVFLMEGIWSKCFPIYQRLREELALGSIGDIKHVNVTFGFPMFDLGNLNNKSVGGGALFAIGCYATQFISMVYGEQQPQRISSTGTLKKGVDANVNATFYYECGGVAQFSISMLCEMENTAVISGSKGMMKVPNFWAPTQMTIPTGTSEIPLPQSPKPMNLPNSEGFTYEVKHVGECISKGLKESPLMSHKMTLLNAELLDQLRQQIGLIYEADNA